MQLLDHMVELHPLLRCHELVLRHVPPLSLLRSPHSGCSSVADHGLLRHRSMRVSHPGLGPHLHGVPRAAEWRGVGEVELAHRVDGHLVEDGGGCDVDPLGHLGVLMPEELEAEETTGPAVARVAHADAVASRVVRLVVVGLELDRDRIEAGRNRLVIP